VIIASSREAKIKGIKTGCIARDAKILDPGVVLLENDPAKYRFVTEKIFKIFKDYTDRFEPYSIDEAFLDLSGWVKSFKEAEKLAELIKERIKTEVGEWLTCSIGISWTKFLAKFAGDLSQKNSNLIISSEKELVKILKNRDLKDAWGIGERMEFRLRQIGIRNLLELKNFSGDRIRRLLGRCGYYLWSNVNGFEITEINQGAPAPKSIGHSYALPKKTIDKEYLKKIFYKLCEKAGRRLRSLEMEADRIHIVLIYIGEGGISRSFKLSEKVFTTEEIFKPIEELVDYSQLLMPVRLLAVSLSSLSPSSGQMSLFEDNLGRKNLSRALDKINNKYGEFTVIKGEMFGAADAARDRIGFRKSVEI
jgi:DNA polymerase IV